MSPISASKVSVRYIPYHPPVVTRAVFKKEQLIDGESSGSSLYHRRVFSLETTQRPAVIPKPRTFQSSEESRALSMSTLLTLASSKSPFYSDFVVPDGSLITKPPGEPGRSGNGTKQGFNLKTVLGWNDFDQISVCSHIFQSFFAHISKENHRRSGLTALQSRVVTYKSRTSKD